MEQHVDIPVPVGGGRNAGLQGFPPEQSSTATLSSAERTSERIVEQIVDFPVAGGGLQEFRPGQSSSSVARSPAEWLTTEDEPFQGVFRTISPGEKSARVTWHMGARVPRHVSSSTSSASGLRSWVDDDTGETWTLLTDPALGSWWYSLRTQNAPSGTRRGSAELGCCWWCTGSRAWHPLAPSWVPLPTLGQVKKTGVHGILESRNAWFDSGYMLCVSSGGLWTIFTQLLSGWADFGS